jgi:hypothetical protein
MKIKHSPFYTIYSPLARYERFVPPVKTAEQLIDEKTTTVGISSKFY